MRSVLDAKTRLGLAWVVLAAITIGYLAIDHLTDLDGTLRASTVVTVGTIVLALVKAKVIFNEFMDARHAPPILRVATNVWILVMAAILIGTYLVSRALR